MYDPGGQIRMAFKLKDEWLRLGGSDAAKAERDLQMKGARSKADTPIKDLEDGAFRIIDASFGYDEGWQNTEALGAARIKLEGYNMLREASVRPPQNHPEACQIYLETEDGTRSTTLAMGEASTYNYLTWDGLMVLQGTWFIDARQLVAYDRAGGSKLNVVYQRIQRGMTA